MKAPVQYGDSWAAWCAYLHTYQLLPLDRISQLFHDMTDYRASYFTTDYSFDHALCGAHLLRECQGIIDYDKPQWAADMQNLLQEARLETKNARKAKIPLDTLRISTWKSATMLF